MKCLLLLILFTPIELFSQQDHYQIYITPRYPSYGFGDNGVFGFELNQSSIKRSLFNSSYNTEISCLDSLNELTYISCDTLGIESFLSEVLDHNVKFRKPRIVIFRSLEHDTIMIDENHMVKLGDKVFLLNEKGISFFYSLMPVDIRLNWLIGRRQMKTIDLDKLKTGKASN